MKWNASSWFLQFAENKQTDKLVMQSTLGPALGNPILCVALKVNGFKIALVIQNIY